MILTDVAHVVNYMVMYTSLPHTREYFFATNVK